MFALCSCSDSAYDNLESEMEEVQNLVINTDNIAKRGMDPWDEEKTPLEWAEGYEGTDYHQPTGANYFYITNELDYVSGEEYNYYAFFDWRTDFSIPGKGYDDNPHNYLMQIQYRYAGENDFQWRYINMPSNKYGLVKILEDGVLEKISAYAFPYGGGPLEIRLRTIHKDFLISTPIPNTEYRERYDRSMFSGWSSPSDGYVGNYNNNWGFGKPQPSCPEGGQWSESDSDSSEGFLLVSIYFPSFILDNRYSFSYKITNTNGRYQEVHDNNSVDILGVGKSSLTKIGKEGGDIEIVATCTNVETNKLDYATQWVSYSQYDNTLDISFSLNDFDLSYIDN